MVRVLWEELDSIIALNSTDLNSLHRQAQQFLNRGDLQQAHACCVRMIQVNPQHADAYFLLGVIAAAMSQQSKAIDLIEKAISFDSQNAEYHAHLAKSRVMVNQFDRARAALQSAVDLQPTDALTQDTIGVVYSRLAEHANAIVWFNQAVAQKPDRPDFQYNLAASLKFVGDFHAAESAYEAAIKAAPNFYKAHSALAQLRTQTTEHNHISRLEVLLPKVKSNVDAHLHIAHALSKELEDVGLYEQAFKVLEQAAGSKKQALNYRFESDVSLFDKIHEVFEGVQPAKINPGFPSTEPIFVVGMPRTGTTLVERIISSHSEVFSAGELQNFGLCVKRLSGSMTNRLLDAETIARSVRSDFYQAGSAYIESTRPATGQLPRFVDKMPLNFLYIGLIRLALPNAKIICLRRDPVDTCLSNFRQLFALNYSYYNYSYDILDTGKYFLQFDYLIRFWKRLFPEGLIEVRYEDLVVSQEQESRRILDYCGLQWEDQCLQFQKNESPVSTASAVQVRQPMYTRAVERWRHYSDMLQPLIKMLREAGIHIDE